MNDPEESEGTPPVYQKLKDLHRTTALVRDGRPNVTIVTPASRIHDAEALRIQEAVRARSGVRVPIAWDDSPAAIVPIRGNLIVLGNRSTNRTVQTLYNRYYTLLDLRYPGPEGHEVRTLHNPFGNGFNVIFVGGSDAVGVASAAEAFIGRLEGAEGGDGRLSVGWLMEIRLGKGIRVPEDVGKLEIWDASAAYGSKGNFGWTSISKRMAAYYMTGDESHAREFLRLAFPDERAKAEISELDDERIENKDEPLSGPYHYGSYTLILYWDLIEESPVFTDEERLRVTNAFSRQFAHPQEWGWRRRIVEKLLKGDAPGGGEWYAGDRHGVWSFVTLYCLARYFQKDYADPLWPACIEAVEAYFDSLHRPDELNTSYEHLYWYNTGIAPAVVYMLLAEDRGPVENGALAALLRGQEVLLSGRERDGYLNAASIGLLHQAAYLTQDGRWTEYLRRTGMDLSGFRLGQSFWPEGHLRPRLPEDLVGRWTVQPMPAPMWRRRASGLPLQESFLVGSFRSAGDESGDFILLKGWNGAGRNPFHTFGLLDLRLGGQAALDGFFNQVMIKADGMVEPEVGMDAALRYREALGQTAVAVGETPKAAFCNWRRTLAQRVGRYAVIVDALTFRSGSENMEVDVLWQRRGARLAVTERGAVRIEGTAIEIRLSDPVETAAEDGRARMTWRGRAEAGEDRRLFSLIAAVKGDSGPLACVRLSENAAALGLPEPGIAVAGSHAGLTGELVVLATDHLYGMKVTEAALGGRLLSADAPVHVDWDFGSGVLEVVAERETEIRLSVEDASALEIDGAAVKGKRRGRGPVSLRVAAGRHTLSGAAPEPGILKRTAGKLEDLLKRGAQARRRSAAAGPVGWGDVPDLPAAFALDLGGRVVDLIGYSTGMGDRICAAEGTRAHVLSETGEALRTLAADGPIRMLRWWKEHDLLLAGCADEKVIAFDAATGERRWTFVSREDPAVFQAAKTYWFKSAPGHEGVHGLHTGVFLNGRSQAFVGGACTLEILDENGGLVKRTAIFWGPGSRFALIDGPEGSIDLLVARRPADLHAPTVLNNRDLDGRESRYRGVPAGHTAIEPWGNLVRNHIFYEDLDGDGKKEILSEINGTWNRVTVWASDGTPLYNANFGPAKSETSITSRSGDHMRDLDVADLDGDGRKEILAATFDGMAVALNCRCEKVWAVRLPSAPTVMNGVKGESGIRVVAGCEDGTVAFMDASGAVLRLDRMRGAPTRILPLKGGVALATEAGEVKAWKL